MNLLRKYRKTIVILLCIFVTLFSLLGITLLRFRSCSLNISTQLEDVLLYIENAYKEQQEDIANYDQYELSIRHTYVRILGEVLKKQKATVEILDHFKLSLPDYTFFFIGKDGTIISNTDAYPIETDLFALLKEDPERTSYITNDDNFAFMNTGNGWLCIQHYRDSIFELVRNNYLPETYEHVLCWELSTGYQMLNTMDPNIALTYEYWISQENDLPSFTLPGNLKLCVDEESHYYVYKTREIDSDHLLFAFADLAYLLRETIQSLFVVYVMIPLVVIIMCLHALRMLDNDEDNSKASRKKLFGKLSLKLDFFYHLTALFLVSFCIVTITTAYVHVLTSFSEQNVSGRTNLDFHSNTVEETNKRHKLLLDYIQTTNSSITRQLAFVLSQDPDLMDTDFLKSVSDDSGLVGIQEISVIDDKGEIIHSNMNNLGYILSTSPESPDYKISEFLNGEEESLSVTIEDYYSITWELCRFKNMPGILRINFSDPGMNPIMTNSMLDSAIDACDFGIAEKYILYSDMPDYLFIQNDIAFDITENDWPELAEMRKPFFGVHRINTAFCHVCTQIFDGGIIIRAYPLRYTFLSLLQILIMEIVIYLVIYGILLFFTACTTKAADPESIHDSFHIHAIPEKFMDGSFNRNIKLMINISLLFLVVIFALDGIFSKNSLTRYLLSSQWDLGLNLFSFTKILMMLITTLVVSSVLRRMIILISRGTSSRGITIGHLLSSMVKFGSLIFFIVYSLVQIGLKLNSLLAGAGLAGAALAFAGQNVVQDLLSGFFIVFEGKYGVGDWVTVDGFRGQILEIGVRTTSIALGDDIRIFHNSALSGITVWSHGMGGAICTIDIAYREDIERVIRIIQENKDRYMAEIPEMEEAPYVHGAIQLGSSGITLRIQSYLSNQANAGRVQRAMLRITKRIFEENNISIPFPQVVVHQGEDDIAPITATLVPATEKVDLKETAEPEVTTDSEEKK